MLYFLTHIQNASGSGATTGGDNQLAAAANYTNNFVAAWGDDFAGQSSVPADLAMGGETAVAAGAYHTCIIHKTGGLRCW